MKLTNALLLGTIATLAISGVVLACSLNEAKANGYTIHTHGQDNYQTYSYGDRKRKRKSDNSGRRNINDRFNQLRLNRNSGGGQRNRSNSRRSK